MIDRPYNFWLVVRPAPDIPGQWVAHCLEVDVVTQGMSLRHAFEMAAEAVCLVLASDLDAGLDPLARRAPEEYWAELYSALHRSQPVELPELFATQRDVQFCAAQLKVGLVRPHAGSAAHGERSAPPPEELVPAAWSSPRAPLHAQV